jgi:hypothetical protein
MTSADGKSYCTALLQVDLVSFSERGLWIVAFPGRVVDSGMCAVHIDHAIHIKIARR